MEKKSIKHRSDYPNHVASSYDLKDGELQAGDLITNTATGAVWHASEFDANSIKPNTFESHKKFKKLVPII